MADLYDNGNGKMYPVPDIPPDVDEVEYRNGWEDGYDDNVPPVGEEESTDYWRGFNAGDQAWKRHGECPVCGELSGRRASALHGNAILPCESCHVLIKRGRDRILEAFQMVARGAAFASDCARSAARDILTDVITNLRQEK